MTTIQLLSFSMRKEAPSNEADWYRIVQAKKGEKAEVYIYDEIGYWGTNAKDFANELRDIDASEIDLHLNTPGGSVFDGLAICAAIKNHKATVTGFVDGYAASAGSFILQACDVRKITRNGMVMIHDAKAYAGGTADQMRKSADVLDKISNDIADIYATRSKSGSVTSWRDTMRAGDTWYDGNEAVEAGLADEVVDNPAEEEGTDNSWTQEEISAFVLMPAATLAQDTARLTIQNEVDQEAQMPTPPTPPAAPQPPAQPNPSAASDLVAVNIGGVEYQVPKEVKAQMEAQNKREVEAKASARKAFINGLAEGDKPKIAATQIGAFEAFVATLDDNQYDTWAATWDLAPAAANLGITGVQPSTEPVNGGGASELDKQILVNQEIVDSLKAGGMTQEVLETKQSWKNLQNLMAQKAQQTA